MCHVFAKNNFYGTIYIFKYTANYTTLPTNGFTGKERDSETGYGYFGARYMDHELMTMWLSVDPMADKYPSISPYAYCGWNPVKLVDPDGREIWLIGTDGIKYQYKKGKIYTENGLEYKGTDAFVTQILHDMETLNNHGLKVLIESLEESSYTHTICKSSTGKNYIKPESNNNISNRLGSSTTIAYNPNLTTVDHWERPAVVGLAHELQHAYEMDIGCYDNTIVNCIKFEVSLRPTFFCPSKITIHDSFGNSMEIGGEFVWGDLERGEYSAVITANRVYMSLGGTHPRKFYQGFSIKQLVK